MHQLRYLIGNQVVGPAAYIGRMSGSSCQVVLVLALLFAASIGQVQSALTHLGRGPCAGCALLLQLHLLQGNDTMLAGWVPAQVRRRVRVTVPVLASWLLAGCCRVGCDPTSLTMICSSISLS